MITKTILVLGLFLVPTAVQASDDVWEESFGQGVFTASVTKGPGNGIHVSCAGGSDLPLTRIDLELAGKAPTGHRVTMIFDGEDVHDYMVIDGAITSDSRAAASNYLDAVERLKRHRWVHVRFENGDGTKFTLNGAAEAIGDCQPDIFR